MVLKSYGNKIAVIFVFRLLMVEYFHVRLITLNAHSTEPLMPFMAKSEALPLRMLLFI